MEKNDLYSRTSIRGYEIRGFSKWFPKNTKGYENGKKYTKKKSFELLKNEILNYEINTKLKFIKIYCNINENIQFYIIKNKKSLSTIKGIYKTTGTFVSGFGDSIFGIIDEIDNIASFTIDYSNESVSKAIETDNGIELSISKNDYNILHGLYQRESTLARIKAQTILRQYLNSKNIGIKFNVSDNSKETFTKEMRKEIFDEVINNLNKNEIHSIYNKLYVKYFESLEDKNQVFKEMDLNKIDYIINEYEFRLDQSKDDEKEWQIFFEKYLFSIQPGYKYIIREVDTIFESLDPEANSRPVDFIVVDIYNNVELIELKTPNASIISDVKDHNNYFFTHQCFKAFVQIEKYLKCLEYNQSCAIKLIKKKVSEKYEILQKDLSISICRPKAKLIIGRVDSFIMNESRYHDFKMQRQSFKNIDIVGYDELLNSLKEIRHEFKL